MIAKTLVERKTIDWLQNYRLASIDWLQHMQISCRQWYEPSKEKDPDIDKLISEYENERNVKDKVLESLRLCESEYESEQKKVRNFGAKSATFLKLNGLLPANDALEG